ncbi:MAG: holo-ACP synthase [Clostridia bacterium]|nr:holo-ACP synthase [Clostridia bacterium]
MKLSTGVDIVEIQRVKQAIEKNDAFINRVYTKNEIDYCEGKGREKYKSYAARFAAKEAYSKAMGTGFGGTLSPVSIEVINNKEGKPYIYINGEKKENCDVSLSHSKMYAVAYVVIFKEED